MNTNNITEMFNMPVFSENVQSLPLEKKVNKVQ